MTTSYTPTVNSTSAALQNNSLGRKFQDPTRADCPVFVKHFHYKNLTGAALADGTIIDLGPVLGQGIVLPQSNVQVSALGASRVFNLGFNSYTNQDSNAAVDGKITALLSAVDVSAAWSHDLSSQTSDANPGGLELFGAANLICSVTGGTIPANATIDGTIFLSKVL